MRCLEREREKGKARKNKQMKDQIMISKLHLGAQINVQSLYVIQLFHIHFLNKKNICLIPIFKLYSHDRGSIYHNLKLILKVLPFKYDS